LKSKKTLLRLSIIVAALGLLVCFFLFAPGGRHWLKGNIGKYKNPFYEEMKP